MKTLDQVQKPKKEHLSSEDRKKYTKVICNILSGYDLDEEHAIYLCERGVQYRNNLTVSLKYKRYNG